MKDNDIRYNHIKDNDIRYDDIKDNNIKENDIRDDGNISKIKKFDKKINQSN